MYHCIGLITIALTSLYATTRAKRVLFHNALQTTMKPPLLSKKRGSDSELSGCGCLFFVFVIGTVGILPSGSFITSLKYFTFIFIALNGLMLYLESYFDLADRIKKKSGISVCVTDESCIDYSNFLKLSSELQANNYKKSFTKTTIEGLKKTLNEFDIIYARLIAQEERIKSSFEEIGQLGKLEQELAQLKAEYKKTSSNATRETLCQHEKVLIKKIDQVNELNSTQRQLRMKRKLILDTLLEMSLKVRALDMKMESCSINIDEELKKKLLDAQSEVKIMENAIKRVF